MNKIKNLKLFKKFLLILLFYLFCFSLNSLECIVLNDLNGKYPVTTYIEYYEDITKKVTIDEINTLVKQNKFLTNNKTNPVFRYNNSNYWIRFKIKNDSATQKKWLLKIEFPWFKTIEFYIPDNNDSFIKKQTGYLFPIKTRDVKNRKIVFSFLLNSNKEETYYMKVFSYNPINLQMSIYSYDAFLQEDHESQIIYGILYGILIIMIFYNLFLFFVLNDKSYLYYSLFVVFFTLHQAALHMHYYEYLPQILDLIKVNSYFIILGLMIIFAFLFAASFLMTKKNNPIIHKIIQINIFLNIFAIIGSLFIPRPIIIIFTNILIFSSVSTALTAGIVSLYKGNRAARFYLLAWGVFLSLNIIFQVLQFILIKFSSYYYYFLMGSGVLNVVLLSVGLADRYRLIRIEKEKIERTNIEQTEFFINLSHEIKTPLTLISNYLEKYLKDQEISNELKIIKQNIDKLLMDMINFFDVLKFQKGIHTYSHGKIINISDFLKYKIELFSSVASNYKIKIKNNIEKKLYIKIDPSALDRIINNLLENAIKYNKANGIIEISIKQVNDNIKLIFKDSGIGINKDQIDKIFLPYYQISHKKNNIQGIGMGLAIVKNIIDELNGEIKVESNINEGSSFIITLKRYLLQDKDDIYKEVDNFNQVSLLTSGNDIYKEIVINEGRYNILFVEDNLDLLKIIKDNMSDIFNIFCSRNGKEALEQLEKIPIPDVIVSDIMMDQMDGYDFFNIITKNEKYKEIPFIFITAKSTVDEKLKGLKKGAIDFIFKPFIIDELIAKIESILKFHELKKENFEKDKFASIGMLLGGISHEIYNPLSGITGPLDNLKKILNKEKIHDKQKINKYIDYIEKNTHRIENIIKNVRALYKKEKLEKNKLNFNEIAMSVIDNYKTDANKKISFEYKIDKNIEVLGDKNACYQILNNLVSNAVDAINKTDKKGNILITLEKENNNKVIKVIDNGTGIIDANIDKIFNAFYTTKTIGNNIGLGLYIVKDLIIKLGWDIKVKSEEQKGTAFSIIVKE